MLIFLSIYFTLFTSIIECLINFCYILYVMKTAKHITYSVLLICYTAIVLAGSREVLLSIYNPGGHNYCYENARESKPLDSKSYLTQSKHLPISIKDDVPSPAILTDVQFPDAKEFDYPYLEFKFSLFTFLEYPRYLPRDPPTA